ncbi:MAG: amidohydrolase [Imperialibacter sp.]|uniref:amidohydrolase n=1 Tax=Imperialibacter sp. TaxID=2038411 RepID=UPI0032EEA460
MKYFGLFLLLICFLTAQAQEQVYFNAKVFTANPQQPYADALAVKGKTIVAVGNYEQVKAKVSEQAEWIDLQGGFVMPGLVDSHNHGIDGGMGLTKANVNDLFLDVDQIHQFALETLKKKEGMTGDVLVIYGLNISTWKALDRVIKLFNSGEFKDQPVFLRGSDWHTAWANKAMLRRAGVTKAYLASLTGDDKKYFGVAADGESNGFVSEDGQHKIEEVLEPDTDFSLGAIKAMEYNNGFGITAFLDPSAARLPGPHDNMLDWYQRLEQQGQLTAHIAATVVAEVNADPIPQMAAVRALQQQYNGNNLQVLGFKVFADGVVEHPTHTAALSLPYTGTQSNGVMMMDPEKFARFATLADKENLLVHVHAIGDEAVTETLNGFEAMRKANKSMALPHTITHLQFVQPADFDRFARLNVLASFQLLWALGDETTIDIVKPYVDPSIYQWMYPVRSMLQAGATICGASDWPVSTANPFEAMYYAETRKGALGVLDASQRMPRMAMLYAYTSEAAKALMMENRIGSLAIGKSADFILLDRDVLTVSPESLKATQVLWTMFEGKKVYETVK